MAQFNVTEEITSEVVEQHWAILQTIMWPFLVEVAQMEYMLGGCGQPTLGDEGILEDITSKLVEIGYKIAPDAFSGKKNELRQNYVGVMATVKKMNDVSQVRFTSDVWRYQKEARQYYSDPVKAFAIELLQNSLDAMSALGSSHQMKITCILNDVVLESEVYGAQPRIQVTFEDNGIGMTRDVLEQGLLRIGGSRSTRTDKNRKQHLSESAGGFGLAKTLLYLAQTSFKIWTKTLAEVEIFVSAQAFRDDQEACSVRNATTFPSVSGPHGTKAVIVLDPWVMEMTRDKTGAIDEDFFTRHALHHEDYSSLEDYAQRFKQVWQRSNLPIHLTLNGSVVSMDAQLGPFQAFIHLPSQGDERRFAALYCKDTGEQRSTCPPMKVLLQTLANRQLGFQPEESPGSFLYLCDLITTMYSTVTLRKSVELSVLLFSSDQHGKPFECSDLLKGTRDDLTKVARERVMQQVQKFIIDPYSVKPPKPRVSWYSNGQRCFSDWLELPDSNSESNSQVLTPGQWRNATRAEARQYFRNDNWRQRVGYNYAVFIDGDYMVGADVPVEFQNASDVDSTNLMWLELFGVFVREVLEVFKGELTSRSKPTSFNVGFYLGKRDFIRPVLPGSDGAHNDKATFLLNRAYIHNFLGDDAWSGFNVDVVTKSMTCLKTLALRELIFLLHGVQEGAESFETFQDYLLRLEESSRNCSWPWFSRYKEIVECRLMRDLQDERSTDELTQLRRHVVAMQTPVNDEGVCQRVLQQERTYMENEIADMRARADKDDPAEEQEMMPNPAARLKRMNPLEIRFSQNNCGRSFRCGRTLETTVKQLVDKVISVDLNIPIINIFKWNGNWFTADNRRLWCYQQAKLRDVPVNVIDFRDVWSNKLTTTNGGCSIRVRG